VSISFEYGKQDASQTVKEMQACRSSTLREDLEHELAVTQGPDGISPESDLARYLEGLRTGFREALAQVNNSVRTDTATHAIEVSDGCLTIGEQTFPDNCITLSREETELVLEVLLIARNGLQPVNNDEE
jgi:hypothetical protein